MNKLQELIRQTEKVVRSNSPVILTALGVSGVISTGYLAHRAGRFTEAVLYAEGPDISFKEKCARTWRFHIPVAVAGTATIVCILGGHRVNSRRAAAISAAYAISEHAFAEYREHVVEKLGSAKERELRDEIVENAVRRNPPPATLVSSEGPGNVLCCELLTKRYFLKDVEALKRAQNEVNNEINKHMVASLSDFYDLIGLDNTSMSDHYGWEHPNLMYLQFTTVMTPDQRPCVAFDYNYIKVL